MMRVPPHEMYFLSLPNFHCFILFHSLLHNQFQNISHSCHVFQSLSFPISHITHILCCCQESYTNIWHVQSSHGACHLVTFQDIPQVKGYSRKTLPIFPFILAHLESYAFTNISSCDISSTVFCSLYFFFRKPA